MSQIDDLNTAVAKLQTDQSAALTDIAAQIAALKAQLLALQGTTAPDLSAAIAAIDALDVSVKAADPGAQPTGAAPAGA